MTDEGVVRRLLFDLRNWDRAMLGAEESRQAALVWSAADEIRHAAAALEPPAPTPIHPPPPAAGLRQYQADGAAGCGLAAIIFAVAAMCGVLFCLASLSGCLRPADVSPPSGSEYRHPSSAFNPSAPRGAPTLCRRPPSGIALAGPAPAARTTRNPELGTRNSAPPWTITAYCPCRRCCGPKACGITASGTRADHRLAAGPPELPFGTIIDVPGYGRVKVEDRGGAIKGRRLDVLFPTHAEARAWGVQKLPINAEAAEDAEEKKHGRIR